MLSNSLFMSKFSICESRRHPSSPPLAPIYRRGKVSIYPDPAHVVSQSQLPARVWSHGVQGSDRMGEGPRAESKLLQLPKGLHTQRHTFPHRHTETAPKVPQPHDTWSHFNNFQTLSSFAISNTNKKIKKKKKASNINKMIKKDIIN